MSLTLPKLEALPPTFQDGSITMRLEEGVPTFSAARPVVERLTLLLEKEQSESLNPSEVEELARYEDIDDYLSHLNRVVRNLLFNGSKNL